MITVERGVREDLVNWFSGRWILIRWRIMQVQVTVGACRENTTVGAWRWWCLNMVKIFIPLFCFLLLLFSGVFLCDNHVGCTCLSP